MNYEDKCMLMHSAQKLLVMLKITLILVRFRATGLLTKGCFHIDATSVCVLVTGVHTGVVDTLGSLLLVVSDATTYLHLCDLQGVGVPHPVIPGYPLISRCVGPQVVVDTIQVGV